MKVALYVRVSTADQTTDNQKRELLRYCEHRKWTVYKVYEDSGISGAIKNRPALDELMRDSRKGRFQTVLVWKFDRFARSTTHLLQALQEFQSLELNFVSFSEGIDTSTSMGKLIYTFLAGISEFERSLIAERVRSGIARAKAEGIHCGRPRKHFDVSKAVELRNSGHSLRSIAKQLDVGYATVFRQLSTVSKPLQKAT